MWTCLALPYQKVLRIQVEVNTLDPMCKAWRSNDALGGAANVYKPSDSERLDAEEHNKKVRSESFNKSQSKERAGVKGIADKAKELLKGKSGGEKD